MGYKAALCTSDGIHVDTPFGQTKRFLVIQVNDKGDWAEVGWRDAPSREGLGHACEPWFEEVAGILSDVDYVWTAHIGPKPHRILLAAGITGMESPTDVDETIAAVNRYRNRVARREAALQGEGPGSVHAS